MLGISDAAEKLGFKTIGVRWSFEKLAEDAPLPCIVHWNQEHFVVVYDIRDKRDSRDKRDKRDSRDKRDGCDNDESSRVTRHARAATCAWQIQLMGWLNFL
jgi:ABC-type bacteriocin/lantibiotic exporter with double-glycine peptidase domain